MDEAPAHLEEGLLGLFAPPGGEGDLALKPDLSQNGPGVGEPRVELRVGLEQIGRGVEPPLLHQEEREVIPAAEIETGLGLGAQMSQRSLGRLDRLAGLLPVVIHQPKRQKGPRGLYPLANELEERRRA